MKSIKIYVLLLAGVLGITGAAKAQSRPPLSLQLNYSIAQPLGSLKDYANKTSFRGWKAGFLYNFNDQFSAGLNVGYQDFYEKVPRAIYPGKDGAISAVQQRTLQTIPIMLAAQYAFTKPESKVIPYVGLNAGIAAMRYEKYWGEFVEGDDSWQFMATPELGINVPFGKYSPVMFNANVQYNYSPYKMGDITNFNTVQANIGVKIHVR
ncbi:outer membrane protein with beta-barrel domain [Chitinophaga skermanii]|uniref:Outer membrane protein with beta-barrel domain n=1 Tax=Chitinophaga skermanii TaxID=331697 RepID=A0A327QF84_9BACT|nr:OmpW family outer membrane protein [Chitinophaga skermanii]RAJ00337.1 outer membrane protein with beta-barrel domain [Chitinophaga skermanii]